MRPAALRTVAIRSSLAAVTALLFFASPLASQVATVQPGARVRFDLPGVHRVEGLVLAAGDTLDIAQRGGARVRVPLAAVDRLELSQGKSAMRGGLRGVRWGAAIGGIMGVVMLPSMRVCESVESCDRPRRLDAGESLSFLGTMGLGGAVWGIGIGAAIGSERWSAVPTRLSVRATRVHHASGVAFALAW